MNSTEARDISMNAPQPHMDEVYDKIKRMAAKGMRSVNVSFLTDEEAHTLELKGYYTVSHADASYTIKW